MPLSRSFCLLFSVTLMAFWNASNSAVHAQPARPEPAVEDTVLEALQNKILVWNTDTSVARRRVANHRFVQDLGRLIRSDVAWDFPWSELHRYRP